jgi:hypothetical protein
LRFISPLLQKPAHENCAVLGYYAASNGNLFPTNYRSHLRVITQQNAVRIYFAAEVGNYTKPDLVYDIR